MPKSHPDYHGATTHLSGIMRKIIKGQYNSIAELRDSFQRWIDRWSNPELTSAYDHKDQVIALGLSNASNQLIMFCILVN